MSKQIPEFKDSKIPWIGRIPKHWEIKRISHLYLQRNQKVSDKDFEPLSVTKQGILPQLENAAKTNDGDNRKLVKTGDFVINSRSDRRGSCGISKFDGSVSLINIVLEPRQNMNSKYFDWLFHTSLFADEFYKYGNGIVDDLWSTRWDNMKKISVVYPPLDEQEKIAKFLDSKCEIIDKRLENLERKIKSLKEYKKSLISECVTKGLNSRILEFKDSKIPWIGKIPKHWEISKIKYVAKIRSENSSFNAENDKYIGLENVAGYLNSLIETNTEYENSIQAVCKKGDILFGKLRPYLSKVIIAPFNCFCSSEFLQFINLKCYFKFFYYFLLNKNFIENVNSSTYGAKMPRANSNYIMNLNCLVPPLNEQKEIAEFLDKKCEKIDRLNENYTKQITALKEYKKSLIYECVTGKKEI